MRDDDPLKPGSITVAIPTIPPRMESSLYRALRSVAGQTLPAAGVAIACDILKEGATATRNRALDAVRTGWVAFLDDDDRLKPHHLQRLAEHAAETGADVVYPWFDVVSLRPTPGFDPLGEEGKPFDPELLAEKNYIPITVLVRTEVIRDVGGFQAIPWGGPDNPCEDWGCWWAMVNAGAKFSHLPERTWDWIWHKNNTSGRPVKW